MATLKVLYFAWLREHTGRGEEDIELPSTVRSVADLMVWLRNRDSAYAKAFANPRLVRAAVNQVFASPETPLLGGEEVAFFPPVTGG